MSSGHNGGAVSEWRRGAKRAMRPAGRSATIERPGEIYRPWIAKEGGERMTDYELLMIVLTVLSLVVVLITKDQK